MLKSILIVVAFILSISAVTESFGQSKAQILKVSKVLSEDQLNQMADSTGMVNVPELCYKLRSYSPNTYYLSKTDNERTSKIIEEAKMHMIEGDAYVFVFGYSTNATIYKYKDSYGKVGYEYRKLDNPLLRMDTNLVKKYKFVFATNRPQKKKLKSSEEQG